MTVILIGSPHKKASIYARHKGIETIIILLAVANLKSNRLLIFTFLKPRMAVTSVHVSGQTFQSYHFAEKECNLFIGLEENACTKLKKELKNHQTKYNNFK